MKDLLANYVLVYLAQLKAVRNVIEDVVVRQECIALEYHSGIALVWSKLINLLIAKENLSLIRALKTSNHAQNSGLSAARRAKQRYKLARSNGDVSVLNCVEVFSSLLILINFGNVLKANAFFLCSHVLLLLECSAGAKVFDGPIHKQYRAIGNNNQNCCKGAGHTI